MAVVRVDLPIEGDKPCTEYFDKTKGTETHICPFSLHWNGGEWLHKQIEMKQGKKYKCNFLYDDLYSLNVASYSAFFTSST